MHIKSLVIDGFKSYGKRVELKDFDPKFNAITGLNGTGKSNILDAICFTLGISAMNTIRASTMQDVIYKNGQAGIQSATVTIHFDNTDKTRSAPHYQHNDEIVISREVGMGSKNIYRINGVTVPAKKIMDFFNSLQMNVNNPHFIIMQGRITKVLNMKPIEILSMIEEAAGTNMYESKKKSLELTVGRKDNKLREIRDVADEEILPTMDTIEKEKKMLEELNLVQGQLKNLQDKLKNWKYVQTLKKHDQIDKQLFSVNELYKLKKNDFLELNQQINGINKELKEMEKSLENDTNKKFAELQIAVDKVEEDKNTALLKVNRCKNNISIEDKNIKDIEKQINNSKKAFEAKRKEISDFNVINAGLDEENKKNTDNLEEIDRKIRSLNSGNIYNDEDSGSVQENINKFNLELQNQQTENQQYAIKIDGLKKKLNGHLIGMKEAQKVYDTQMAELAAKEREYEKVKNEYLKANEELDNHNILRSSRDSLFREIRDLNSKIESFESNNCGLFFQYNDPRPNFDRSKVYGLICRLFSPIDFKFELALTTLAGGKLFFIVVEDDTVGKDILETNKFPNRKNFIPLSKIKSDSLSPNVIRIAQQIGGVDNVFPAMSLIKYDQKHTKAIQWVFGQAFICTTKEIAEKVCFDNRVNKHCFTLDGDHFNPSGSLTGGANTQRLVLQAIANQDKLLSTLQEKKDKFTQIDKSLAAIASLPDKVIQLRDQQITVQEKLDKIRSDVHLGQPHQQVTEVNIIKQQIVDLEKNLTEGNVNEKQLQSKIKDLELKMKNAKNILKQQLSDAEKVRNNILSKLKNNKAEYDKKQNNYNILELEINDLTNQIQEEEHQLAELHVEKSKFEEELITLKSEFDKANTIYMKAYNEYECQKQEVFKKTSDYERLQKEEKASVIGVELIKVDLLELEAEKKKKDNELDSVKNMLNQYEEKMSNDEREIAKKMDYTNFNSGKIYNI